MEWVEEFLGGRQNRRGRGESQHPSMHQILTIFPVPHSPLLLICWLVPAKQMVRRPMGTEKAPLRKKEQKPSHTLKRQNHKGKKSDLKKKTSRWTCDFGGPLPKATLSSVQVGFQGFD